MFKIKLRKYSPKKEDIDRIITILVEAVGNEWQQLDYVITRTHPQTNDISLFIDKERASFQIYTSISSEKSAITSRIQQRMQKDGLNWCQMWLKVQKDASGKLTHELTFNYDSEFTTPPNAI